jgi:hypothetical protein
MEQEAREILKSALRQKPVAALQKILSGFPRDVKLGLGYSLRRLQNGEFPACETRRCRRSEKVSGN